MRNPLRVSAVVFGIGPIIGIGVGCDDCVRVDVILSCFTLLQTTWSLHDLSNFQITRLLVLCHALHMFIIACVWMQPCAIAFRMSCMYTLLLTGFATLESERVALTLVVTLTNFITGVMLLSLN